MRFLHDPQFQVIVNGEAVGLEALEGRLKSFEIEIEGVNFEVSVIGHAAKTRTVRPGIAFWVGGRLVGEPSWIIGSRALVDGRTTVGRQHTIVVQSDDLYDEVESDWTGFRYSDLMKSVFSGLADRLEILVEELFTERVQETQESVVRRHGSELKKLRPLGRREVSTFIQEITREHPTIQPELLSAAVKAAINLAKSRSGSALLNKLSTLGEDDVVGLNRLLEDWSVKDALAVLDEIDRRIAVIEALERLSEDVDADELRTLHPLVTQSRWLFGPEYDSPMYSSNQTLRNAAKRVFGKDLDPSAFINARRRPDLVVLKDASVSLVGCEDFDHSTNLATMRQVLLLELKRGRSTISREDVAQAEGYVQDLQLAGIDGPPFFRTFVVGHEKDERVEPTRTLGDPTSAKIQVTTYSQLVRTARRRLFNLRDELAERYEGIETDDLLRRAIDDDGQIELDESAMLSRGSDEGDDSVH